MKRVKGWRILRLILKFEKLFQTPSSGTCVYISMAKTESYGFSFSCKRFLNDEYFSLLTCSGEKQELLISLAIWTACIHSFLKGAHLKASPCNHMRGHHHLQKAQTQLLSQRRQWRPTPVHLPGKSHGQRSLVGCSPCGCYESDMTERLHFHALKKEVATHSSVLFF